MENSTQRIVNKAWSYAHVLRDAGLPFHAYTEQITFLLFLKMADERTKPPYERPPMVPPELGWVPSPGMSVPEPHPDRNITPPRLDTP